MIWVPYVLVCSAVEECEESPRLQIRAGPLELEAVEGALAVDCCDRSPLLNNGS